MEEEEVTSCCCSDADGTGGFISAVTRMMLHLEFIEQRMGDLLARFHEDDFDVSAGHRQKNAPSL